ncbi:MAG TPA: hypothetical protein VHN99_08965 [Deinococcales bacterium]|nr:hypothetical protein [Deinococcales bacterium]
MDEQTLHQSLDILERRLAALLALQAQAHNPEEREFYGRQLQLTGQQRTEMRQRLARLRDPAPPGEGELRGAIERALIREAQLARWLLDGPETHEVAYAQEQLEAARASIARLRAQRLALYPEAPEVPSPVLDPPNPELDAAEEDAQASTLRVQELEQLIALQRAAVAHDPGLTPARDPTTLLAELEQAHLNLELAQARLDALTVLTEAQAP